MSKKSISIQRQILKIAEKVKFLEDKHQKATGKKKHKIWLNLYFKKKLLRMLCKLYIWKGEAYVE